MTRVHAPSRDPACRACAREPRSAPCAHCGRAVPSGSIRPDRSEAFCCAGCETARHAIRRSGLERYYEHAREHADAEAPAAARGTGARYDEYDDPAFAAMHCAPVAGHPSWRSVMLVLEGMHCAACVWLLERLPTVVKGVREVRVDAGRSTVAIEFDAEAVTLSEIARSIDRLGYASHPLRDRAALDARRHEDRASLVRIGIAGAILGNTMLIAFALYGGMFEGMEPVFASVFRWMSAGLATLSLAWPGRVFFRGALASIRVRTLHMDVPVAIALAVGLVHGIVNTVRGAGDVYFDTLTTLVFLLLIGRWIQQRQQRRAADAVELLFSLTPANATLIAPEGARTVPVQALHPGDLVEVAAGGSVPIDGVIIEGRSTLNLALLTGESAPRDAGPGDPVAAGTVNIASPIRVRVEATGQATRVGQLMALVAEHARRRAPIVRLADRVAAGFVLVVLILAAATLAGWMLVDPSHAVEHAVALLIITCPCALGLATPLAVVAAIGRAARRGILVKGGESLEALASTGTVVFDKTGTLTLGELRVARFVGPDRIKPLIAAAEERCTHPAARALARLAPHGEHRDARVTQTLGGGIEAEVDGTTLRIGSPRFVLSACVKGSVPAALQREIDEAAESGLTPVLIAERGAPSAVAVLADGPRPESAAALASIRRMGWKPVLLSGDDPRIARSVGVSLGIADQDAIGGASPEQKIDVIRALAASGRVVMVGDGVNDAAALAAATVGVAVHGGAEAALAAADVYLVRPGLAPFVELIEGARATAAAIKRNLIVSLLYNVVFGGLAVAGCVNPLVAAVLMPISSMTVVVLSFRTRAFRGPALEVAR